MSNIRKSIVSNCEKKFLLKNLSEWTRLDGRAFDEFRKVSIDFGKDWGCCHVSLGKTRVVSQVSAEIQQPKSSRPSEGILNLNIELNPLAAPNFEPGRQSDLSVQLNRLLEKCLKDSKALDLESLCIKMNEKVWAIRVDINVLNYEGNILDCASIAALASLAHFRRPDITCDGEEFIIHSVKHRDPIPMVIHHYPVCITYSIFNRGEFIIADPTLQEEGVADAFMSVGLNSYKELCGLHLGGKADLTPDVILTTANKAAGRAGQVVQQIKETIEKDNQERLEKQKHGFGLGLLNINIEDEVPGDISTVIDQWVTKEKKSKKKNKHKEKERISNNITSVEERFNTAEIQKCGERTAALVPADQKDNAWNVIDSDNEDNDDDIEIVEVPKEIIDLRNANTDSEEDVVVVLNADDKTKKKKRKKNKMKTNL